MPVIYRSCLITALSMGFATRIIFSVFVNGNPYLLTSKAIAFDRLLLCWSFILINADTIIGADITER